MKAKPHVVIIGAGFAGIEAARYLWNKGVRLTLVDRQNHHLFQPLLYQVATAGLSPADISMPVRSLFRGTPEMEVILAEVTAIDVHGSTVRLGNGEVLSYDGLLVASGVRHSYFGHPEWEPVAPGLKTLDDATEIRRRILLAFEEAERERDEERQRTLLTFVIVGAGPTGIEMAGAIAELAKFALVADFNRINPSLARIVLVEAAPAILQTFPSDLAKKAEQFLGKLGVEVLMNKRVTNITTEGVYFGDEMLPSATVIWAAGVAASPLGKLLGAPTDRSGRVLVESDLSVTGYRNVFVAGDLASLKDDQDRPVPGVAPAAMQQGKHAARNVLAQLSGNPTKSFAYKDKGQLATIGRVFAVAQIGRMHLSGFAAWLVWVVVHIFYLVSFRNRLLVMIEWAWSYATYQRGTRLITGSINRLARTKATPVAPEA